MESQPSLERTGKVVSYISCDVVETDVCSIQSFGMLDLTPEQEADAPFVILSVLVPQCASIRSDTKVIRSAVTYDNCQC